MVENPPPAPDISPRISPSSHRWPPKHVRLVSGRYTSYWNVFLLKTCIYFSSLPRFSSFHWTIHRSTRSVNIPYCAGALPVYWTEADDDRFTGRREPRHFRPQSQFSVCVKFSKILKDSLWTFLPLPLLAMMANSAVQSSKRTLFCS